MPTRDSVYELVRTLNSSLGEHALIERVLVKVYDTYWPQFEESFKVALSEHPIGAHIPARSEENMLSKILRTIRSLDRRIRTIERTSEVLDNEREKRLIWNVIRSRAEEGFNPDKELIRLINEQLEEGVTENEPEE
jgi:hypothetical protein